MIQIIPYFIFIIYLHCIVVLFLNHYVVYNIINLSILVNII